MADPTNTVTSGFLTEITADETVAAGSLVTSLEELNSLFTSWVQMVYHRQVHSATSMTPLARFEAGWGDRHPDRRSPEVIAEAFRWSVVRKVTKTATVALHSNTYQVDPLLAGTKVELVYDPFDLTQPITVLTADGADAGAATVLEIRRHVHPKATNAAKDADAGASNAATGIDYLRMVESRHTATVTGARISYDTISDHNPITAPAAQLQGLQVSIEK